MANGLLVQGGGDGTAISMTMASGNSNGSGDGSQYHFLSVPLCVVEGAGGEPVQVTALATAPTGHTVEIVEIVTRFVILHLLSKLFLTGLITLPLRFTWALRRDACCSIASGRHRWPHPLAKHTPPTNSCSPPSFADTLQSPQLPPLPPLLARGAMLPMVQGKGGA